MTRPPLAHKVDTSRRYVPAVATDIRKTFVEVQKRQVLAALVLLLTFKERA